MFFTILVWRFPGVLNAPEAMRRWAVRLALLGDDLASDVAALVAAFVAVLRVVLPLCAALGLVMWLLANPVIVVALLIIAAYGWLTFPTKKVRK